MDFAAIDFETANKNPSSICSIGIVIVRQNRIVDSIYTLVCPEPEYYSYFNTRVHGLQQCDTCQALNFKEVWEQIYPQIEGLNLFAHNASFDERCLRAAYETYQMEYPPRLRFHDTLRASRKAFKSSLPNHQLQTVATACGFDMKNHHHALCDAEACAQIAIALERYFDLT